LGIPSPNAATASLRRRRNLGEQIGRHAPARLLLIVEIAQLLSVLIADDEAGVVHLVDRPRQREAAGGHSLKMAGFGPGEAEASANRSRVTIRVPDQISMSWPFSNVRALATASSSDWQSTSIAGPAILLPNVNI